MKQKRVIEKMEREVLQRSRDYRHAVRHHYHTLDFRSLHAPDTIAAHRLEYQTLPTPSTTLPAGSSGYFMHGIAKLLRDKKNK